MGREDWVRGVKPGNRLRLIIIECWVLSCTGNLWNIGDVVGWFQTTAIKWILWLKWVTWIFGFPMGIKSYLYTLLWPRLSQWLSGEKLCLQYRRHRRCGFNPWIWKIPWMRKWKPTSVFLHGESHAQRSLVHYTPRSHKSETLPKQLSPSVVCMCNSIMPRKKTFHLLI